MVGKNIGHGGFMIEIKNIVKTLSPERNPSTRLKTDNLRYSAFSAELENSWKMGPPRDTVYSWGKGVCKHKTGDCRLRRLAGQKRSMRRILGF